MSEQVCGDIAPGWKVRMSCVKPKGHSGNHEDCHGCWWRNYSSPIPEPSPEPEAAPASEAQAPAEPDERPKCPDCNSVGMSHWSDPEHCGGVYWPDSKYQALRAELTQLRARAAILDAQEVELPASAVEERRLDGEYQTGKEYLDDRVAELERQLLDAQRAVQAQRTIMCDLRNGLVAARDFIDSGDSGWFPQKWRDAIAAYDALAGKGE